jgi:hypothetical protein
MSDYTVILEVSNKLRDLLWDNFDPPVRDIVGTKMGIVFTDPKATDQPDAQRLSVWLFHVTEDGYVKNQPVVQGKGSRDAQQPPLALNLHYLITPFGGAPDKDLLLLGKTVQVLYDNAVVPLKVADAGVAQELRVVLRALTIEELGRVWEALQEPYRLSVSYQVRVITVDSARAVSLSRISDAAIGSGAKPAVAGVGGPS